MALQGLSQAAAPDLPDSVAIAIPGDKADMKYFPLVFNIDDLDVDWTGYTCCAFEGGGLKRVFNPDISAGNESDFVLEFTKTATAGSALFSCYTLSFFNALSPGFLIGN
jgi:hypothetical protein